MNILVIGSGGREHALCDKIKQSPSCENLYAAPGNPGIFQISQVADINHLVFNEVVSFCKDKEIDLVVVGPEQPLADGLSDYLRDEGINVFGPSKIAAELETSKGFAKDFMQRSGIPTAEFRQFNKSNFDEAHQFIDVLDKRIVIKADGLAAGKGVIIPETITEAHNAIDEIADGMFSTAGDKIVIEEFLEGEEASLFVICDGQDYLILPSAQDHKRIFDDDKGLNTGGMGAFSPAGLISDEILKKVENRIIIPLLQNMKAENMPYQGCLFIGLMIENNEPNVIEFNVRFGDPETEAVMRLINGDFAELLYSAAIGKINKNAINIEKGKFACCVILASDGYPGSFSKGYEITGIDEATSDGAVVYHSGTKLKENKLVSNGGRVLAVTSSEDSLPSSISKAYEYCNKIHFENKYNRTDIGKKGLKYI